VTDEGLGCFLGIVFIVLPAIAAVAALVNYL
jgi:hypothetical protein